MIVVESNIAGQVEDNPVNRGTDIRISFGSQSLPPLDQVAVTAAGESVTFYNEDIMHSVFEQNQR